MKPVDVSVLLPVRDVEHEICGILHTVAGQLRGVSAELIIVDMGSHDRTVWEAVQWMEKQKQYGFVLQSGSGTVASALNSAVQKAGGAYLTFVFARRLYRDFIPGYYETAVKSGADFVFGSVTPESGRSAERRLLSKAMRQKSREELFTEMETGKLSIDISALMLRRGFLLENQVFFSEDCRYGYAEEFLYRCLLLANVVVQSPTVLKRDTENELQRPKVKKVGNEIFQRVEAMLRIEDLLHTVPFEKETLLRVWRHTRLPLTVMDSVDVLLREGESRVAVRSYLRVSGYDRLLLTGRETGTALKRRIHAWKTLPWLYRPTENK